MSSSSSHVVEKVAEQLDAPFHINDEWVVIRGNSLGKGGFSTEYFFVWIGKQSLSAKFVSSATKLGTEAYRDVFPGFSVTFRTEPSPGFVVHTRRRWDFEDGRQAAVALEKILWETNRLVRT